MFGAPQIQPSTQKKASSTSVENVRAMPDPKMGHRPPGLVTSQPQKSTGDLFASESDEDDLFGAVKSSNKVSSVPSSLGSIKPQITTNSMPKPAQGKAGGLFSSTDDDDDQGIFNVSNKSSRGNSDHKAVNEAEEESKKEETLEPPKAKPGPKLPSGAVSIFGSAITAAIRRPSSSDSEADNDDQGWVSRKSSVSSRRSLSKTQSVTAPSTATKIGAVGGGGLFDDEDDDDLFGAVQTKHKTTAYHKVNPEVPKISSNTVEKTDSAHANPKSSGLFSDEDDDLFGSSGVKKVVSKNPNSTKDKSSNSQKSEDTTVKPKSSGLFSDEDDDLFGSKSKVEEKKPAVSASNIIVSKPISDTQTKSSADGEKYSQPVPNSSIFSDSDDDGLFGSPSIKTAPKSIEPASNKSSNKETITQERPKSISIAPVINSVNKGLFSSPSDEDDLFAPPPLPETSKFKIPDNILVPPASNPQNTNKTSNDLFASPSSEDDLFQVSKSSTVNLQKSQASSSEATPNVTAPKEVLPVDSQKGDIFSEDDLFSESSANISDKKPTNPPALTNTHTNTFSSVEKDDDIFASNSLKTTETQSKEQSKKPENEKDIFGSPDEDDIFSVVSKKASNIPQQADSTKINDGDTRKEPQVVESSSSSPAVNTQRKKPPIGGVSIFGDTDILAKVKQRKNQVDPDVENVENNIQKEEKKEEKIDNSDVTEEQKKSSVGDLSLIGGDASVIKKEAEGTADKSVNNELIKDGNEIVNENNVDIQPVKPRKKPPIGGVSMFGGNELFSKIKQRKKTLNEDSSEEEVDNIKEEPNKRIEKRESESSDKSTSDSSNRLSAESAVFSTPVSPLSPMFTGSPMIPSRTPSTGGEEKGFSFEEPTAKNTLHSLNKSRSRGSLKRRPPSRKHRQALASSSDDVDGTKKIVSQSVKDQANKEASGPIAASIPVSVSSKPEPTPSSTPLSSYEDNTNTTAVINPPESSSATIDTAKLNNALKVDDDDGGEDLFSSPKQPTNTSDGTVKEKEELNIRKKPPVGGVSMFGGSELFAKITQRKKTMSESDNQEEGKSDNNKNKNEQHLHTSSSISEKAKTTEKVADPLFDKQDNDDDGDLFKSSVSNKAKIIKDDVFSTDAKPESNDVSIVNKNESKSVLLDSSIKEVKPLIKHDSEDDLFSKPRISSSLSKSGKAKAPVLFGDDDSDDDLFGGSKSNSRIPKTTPSNDNSKSSLNLFNSPLSSKPKGATSLFADDDDDEGDIFSSSSNKDSRGRSDHSGSVKSDRSESASSGSSSAKAKGNLQASTGPFEDPLMGPL
ncbi:unnamed protein product [Meganyctiphanes norvegica]|uniref:FAM21/CAPZIP domain-containing protein n=1 Tax=Meganyctiphanes norvegica TaxID=48144 RepID=A0AAV2R368_MEGNR